MISKEALLHHMTVFTTSTRVRSEVTGFTSGRGSTQAGAAHARTRLTAGMRPGARRGARREM